MSVPIATTALAFERLDEPTMRTRTAAFLATMQRRRSVRSFAPDPIPLASASADTWARPGRPMRGYTKPWPAASWRGHTAFVTVRPHLAAPPAQAGVGVRGP